MNRRERLIEQARALVAVEDPQAQIEMEELVLQAEVGGHIAMRRLHLSDHGRGSRRINGVTIPWPETPVECPAVVARFNALRELTGENGSAWMRRVDRVLGFAPDRPDDLIAKQAHAEVVAWVRGRVA
jgi:hypothetical protein